MYSAVVIPLSICLVLRAVSAASYESESVDCPGGTHEQVSFLNPI